MTDNEFITHVCHEFRFPTEIATELVRVIRSTLSDNTPLHSSRYFDMMNLLLDANNHIESITINTARGPVELSAPDPYFEMFYNPIEKISRKYLKDATGVKDELLHGQKLIAFNVVTRFVIDQTFVTYGKSTKPVRRELTHEINLIPYRQRLSIARFVLHFELWAKPGHVLKTEDQWNKNPTEDKTYNKYLASQINSRLKNLNT